MIKRLIDTIFKHPADKLWVQIIRYLISGGLAFVADTGLLYLLTDLVGFHYLLSTTLSFIVGLIITYLFSIIWVFDNRSMKSKYAEFTVFVMIGVVGLLLTNAFMWLFTDKIGTHYLLSKIITTVLVFVWNFIAKKSLLFRSKRDCHG